MMALSFVSSLRSSTSSQLYTQKKFGWSVTQYTNYEMFWVGQHNFNLHLYKIQIKHIDKFPQSVHIAIKGFLIVPFLCYHLKVHDCILAIMGLISGIEEYLVFAFATKGWHMYFAVAMSAFR